MNRCLLITSRVACGRFVRLLGVVAMMAGLATGCASPFADQRVQPYTPRIPAAERMPWQTAATGAPTVTPGEVATPVGSSSINSSGSPTRTLRRDDRVIMSLLGIPRPEEVSDVVDGEGRVKLPHIGGIRVEGLTSAEAEEVIEKAYIEGGIYNNINVILKSQEDVFFVQGEVTRPGKYSLTGDTSVLMAISAAGGYTDFGNRRKISVRRGDQMFRLNAERIEQRKDDDFLIEPNDIIDIDRKLLF